MLLLLTIFANTHSSMADCVWRHLSNSWLLESRHFHWAAYSEPQLALRALKLPAQGRGQMRSLQCRTVSQLNVLTGAACEP